MPTIIKHTGTALSGQTSGLEWSCAYTQILIRPPVRPQNKRVDKNGKYLYCTKMKVTA